jgi:hypothetical protein
MAMRDRGENLLGDSLGKESGALGLTRGAEVSGLAREGEEVLAAARGTPNAGEPGDEAPTVEKAFPASAHDGAQWPRSRLEALLVEGEVALEVTLEESVERAALGMAGSINRHRFVNSDTRKRRGEDEALAPGRRVAILGPAPRSGRVVRGA